VIVKDAIYFMKHLGAILTSCASSRLADATGNRKFVDSPLEGDGFELLVRERGEAGLSRPFDAPVCLGRVGSRWSDPATRSALREQIPIAVSELADQYLMRSVTWASSSLTAKAASLNRGRLITARIPFDNA